MQDSYYGPKLKKKEQKVVIGPSKEEVKKLLKNFGKKLGFDYTSKEETITQEQEEISELNKWLDKYR
jgi:hypothetical protein